MGTYEVAEPAFDGTSNDRWVEPDWEDLAGNRPDSVAGHFLICAGGFPPESVSDLEIAVVDEMGRLNRNALADAIYGTDSVETLDVSESTAEAVEETATELLSEHFQSMPESKQEIDDLLLTWRQQQQEHAHDVEQRMHTDDDARYHEVKGQLEEKGEERPEKGR